MSVKCPSIRPIAIGIFRKRDHLLVGHAFDRYKDEHYCRPPGGGIEFGERAIDALQRELREEIRAEIQHARLLWVLENLFKLEGKSRHEIVFVFEARFADIGLYDAVEIPIFETGWDGALKWEPLSRFRDGGIPLYPAGLLELVS